MNNELKCVKLVDLCNKVIYGYTASATNNSTGIKFLRVTDIADGNINWDVVPFCEITPEDYEKYKLYNDDIVIARMGTIGVSAWIKKPPKAVAASYLIIFRINSKLANPRFISYLLRSPYYWDYIWTHGGYGAVQPNINAKVLGEFKFLLPPLNEQGAIAHILGTLDDKIELNRRMSETLEQMARAIFKAWFVDFEPVRAKMSGHWKKGQSLPGLPAHLWDLFPDRLVNSELGEIPDGWEIVKFEELVSAKQGNYIPEHLVSSRAQANRRYPVWGGNGIRGYTDSFIFDKPVVVLTCRGSNCGLLKYTTSPSWITNISFACESKFGSSFFLYLYLSFINIKDYITGSAQPQIVYSSIKDITMQYPIQHSIAQIFSSYIYPIFQKIIASNAQSDILAEIRDALLPKLISGEIRVKDAEKILDVML